LTVNDYVDVDEDDKDEVGKDEVSKGGDVGVDDGEVVEGVEDGVDDEGEVMRYTLVLCHITGYNNGTITDSLQTEPQP